MMVTNYKLVMTVTILLLVTPFMLAASPGIPHQFYGTVTVNSELADNNKIVAVIQGEEYKTISDKGYFGKAPGIFYIEDPQGENSGETIDFYVGGYKAKSVTFQSNGYTRLDFDLTTSCGDDYCLGSETCSTCSNDCGICTDPPIVTIESPIQDNVYTNEKINVNVFANQKIFIWVYNLNDQGKVSFNPNITLTLPEGNHKLTITAMSDENSLTGSKTASFSIDLPEDNPNNGGSSSGGSSSGSSGSSGSGSGGGSTINTAGCSENWTCLDWSNIEDNCGTRTCIDSGNCESELFKPIVEKDCLKQFKEENNEFDAQQDTTSKTTLSGITGAAIAFLGGSGNLLSLVILIILIGGVVYFFYYKKKK